jgi:hypothetical protein
METDDNPEDYGADFLLPKMCVEHTQAILPASRFFPLADAMETDNVLEDNGADFLLCAANTLASDVGLFLLTPVADAMDTDDNPEDDDADFLLTDTGDDVDLRLARLTLQIPSGLCCCLQMPWRRMTTPKTMAQTSCSPTQATTWTCG